MAREDDAPMTNSPDLRFLFFPVPHADFLQVLLVQLSEHAPRNLPALCNHLVHSSKVLRVVTLDPPKPIHDLVTCLEGSLAQSKHLGTGVSGDFSQDSEIDSERSDTEVRHDDVGCDEWELPVGLRYHQRRVLLRCELTHVGGLVSVWTETKHPVTRHFDVDGVRSLLDRFGGDDVLHPSILLLAWSAVLHGVGASGDPWFDSQRGALQHERRGTYHVEVCCRA